MVFFVKIGENSAFENNETEEKLRIEEYIRLSLFFRNNEWYNTSGKAVFNPQHL
jgi:hypothetical protein